MMLEFVLYLDKMSNKSSFSYTKLYLARVGNCSTKPFSVRNYGVRHGLQRTDTKVAPIF